MKTTLSGISALCCVVAGFWMSSKDGVHNTRFFHFGEMNGDATKMYITKIKSTYA